MTESRREHALSERDDNAETTPVSDKEASADTPVAQSVVSRFPEIRLTAVLAGTLGILLVAFVVDVDPVVRYGIGLGVFALYLWWFVTTGVAVLNRLGD